MKNYVRVCLTLLLLSSSLLLTSFNSLPDDDEYIFVRVFESTGLLYTSKITVTDGRTILDSIDLMPMRPKNGDNNVLRITALLNKIKKKGYTLITSHSAGSENFTTTDYVFEKNKM